MLIENKKRTALLYFWLVSAIYLFIYWFTFKGFNGTDDLHYAMLASNVLKGSYSPFVATDIFSGRVLLVLWQSLIYFLGGVNAFTTQIGTLLTTVLCCYLTLFKLGKYNDWQPVLVGAALFYFNPVLKEATSGILPDIYILLAAIIVFILWEEILKETRPQRNMLNGMLCGLVIFAGMFFKENALLFIPFLLFIALTGERKKTIPVALIGIATFCVCVAFSGLIYYHFTGDFFFRILQIKNSDYPNACNYETLPAFAFIIRLTYGVWQQFIAVSFYPVILASLLIVLSLIFDRSFKLKENNTAKVFMILLLLGLYFPFSLKGYQPLCFMSRHFIFLLSPAVLLCVQFLEESRSNKILRSLFIAASVIILLVCITSTNLKWYWMLYALLLLFFVSQKIITTGFLYKTRHFFLAGILFIYMLYRVFFLNTNWYTDMQTVSAQTTGNTFYFPDHDNMMHFELIQGFKKNNYYYNLEKYPFKIFVPYYENPDNVNFKNGWLIVNKAYNVMPPKFFAVTDSLKAAHYFTQQVTKGSVDAFYIDTPEKLIYVKTIIQSNETITK